MRSIDYPRPIPWVETHPCDLLPPFFPAFLFFLLSYGVLLKNVVGAVVTTVSWNGGLCLQGAHAFLRNENKTFIMPL